MEFSRYPALAKTIGSRAAQSEYTLFLSFVDASTEELYLNSKIDSSKKSSEWFFSLATIPIFCMRSQFPSGVGNPLLFISWMIFIFGWIIPQTLFLFLFGIAHDFSVPNIPFKRKLHSFCLICLNISVDLMLVYKVVNGYCLANDVFGHFHCPLSDRTHQLQSDEALLVILIPIFELVVMNVDRKVVFANWVLNNITLIVVLCIVGSLPDIWVFVMALLSGFILYDVEQQNIQYFLQIKESKQREVGNNDPPLSSPNQVVVPPSILKYPGSNPEVVSMSSRDLENGSGYMDDGGDGYGITLSVFSRDGKSSSNSSIQGDSVVSSKELFSRSATSSKTGQSISSNRGGRRSKLSKKSSFNSQSSASQKTASPSGRNRRPSLNSYVTHDSLDSAGFGSLGSAACYDDYDKIGFSNDDEVHEYSYNYYPSGTIKSMIQTMDDGYCIPSIQSSDLPSLSMKPSDSFLPPMIVPTLYNDPSQIPKTLQSQMQTQLMQNIELQVPQQQPRQQQQIHHQLQPHSQHFNASNGTSQPLHVLGPNNTLQPLYTNQFQQGIEDEVDFDSAYSDSESIVSAQSNVYLADPQPIPNINYEHTAMSIPGNDAKNNSFLNHQAYIRSLAIATIAGFRPLENPVQRDEIESFWQMIQSDDNERNDPLIKELQYLLEWIQHRTGGDFNADSLLRMQYWLLNSGIRYNPYCYDKIIEILRARAVKMEVNHEILDYVVDSLCVARLS